MFSDATIIDLYVGKNRFCQAKKETSMKFIGATVMIAGLIFGAAYIGGVFDADVNIQVNPEVKNELVNFTSDTIEKTKQNTDDVLNKLQQKLEEQSKEK